MQKSDPTTPRMPFICTDMCNDCRSATSSLIPAWICVPAEMVSLSCLRRDDPAQPPEPKTEAGFPKLALAARPWLSGASDTAGTHLKLFASRDSPESSVKTIVRSFCGRCGTNMFYVADPMPFGFPEMIDVILGTVDRADLEKEYMRPERQLWWDYGIPWVKDLVKGFPGPKHPEFTPTEMIQKQDA